MTKELYALSNNRSTEAIIAFLNRFLPERVPFADEFQVPEYADKPVAEFSVDIELIDYLVEHSSETYSVYWNDMDPTSSRQAMAFFTSDRKVILGLALELAGVEELQLLADFVGAEFSRFGDEQPPPLTSQDFIAQCKRLRP